METEAGRDSQRQRQTRTQTDRRLETKREQEEEEEEEERSGEPADNLCLAASQKQQRGTTMAVTCQCLAFPSNLVQSRSARKGGRV